MAPISAWIQAALSDEQQKPFKRETRDASLVAAAGSGKTRTLTHLVAGEVEAGIAPSAIVAFTFTEKAAKELLSRIHTIAAKQLPEVNLTGLYIGTIHAWCLDYVLSQSDYYNVSSVDELHLGLKQAKVPRSLDCRRSCC